MAMEIKHLTTQMHDVSTKALDMAGKAIDEISRLRAENAELKAKLENVQASMYCDVVDANMEVRRLRRYLYKACANWASCESCILAYFRIIINAKKWERMYYKCIEMADKYKEAK